MCSLNNYKPSVSLSSYTTMGADSIKPFHANAYESLLSVIQSISRNARLSDDERTFGSLATRVYFF